MENHDPFRAGLYIHVPFCRGKCPYCDFYSVAAPERVPAWLRALEREAALYRDRFDPFDTLYLGGGTPSLLEAPQLALLMEGVRRAFRFTSEAEVSIEVNPDDVTREGLRLYRDLGFNRLSLGVQSLEEEELRFLGRRHTARRALESMEAVGEAGFEGFGVDLIYGLPGQRTDSWLRTLERVLSFGPTHLSCYQLTLGKESPLAERIRHARLSLPGEEEAAALFVSGARFLEGRGFVHYEVSNFARPRRSTRRPGEGGRSGAGSARDPASLAEQIHACRHNLKYWIRIPYLGLGPSAHSFSGETRWWNVRSVQGYCASLEKGLPPVAASERLDPDQALAERVSLGLRTCLGVSLAEIPEGTLEREEAARLLREGYLERTEGRIVPTLRGYLVADHLPLFFL